MSSGLFCKHGRSEDYSLCLDCQSEERQSLRSRNAELKRQLAEAQRDRDDLKTQIDIMKKAAAKAAVEDVDIRMKMEDAVYKAQRERDESQASAAALREALEVISRPDELLQANENAFASHAAARMQQIAQTILSTDTGKALLERLHAAEAVCELINGRHPIAAGDKVGAALDAWRAAQKKR